MDEFLQTWERGDAATKAAADRELAAGHVETFLSRVQRYIEAAERGCAANEMLLVLYYGPAGERVRIGKISYHHPQLVILQGVDPHGEVCHVLANTESLQLVLKKTRLEDPKQRRGISFSIVE